MAVALLRLPPRSGDRQPSLGEVSAAILAGVTENRKTRPADLLLTKLSVPADATVRDGLTAIDRGGLGTVIVSDDAGRFVALATDGDIRRALLAGVSLDDRLLDIARPDSTVGRAGMERAELAALLSDRVRVLPVLDNAGRVVDLAHVDRRFHLPVAEPELGDRELAYLSECILSGWISSAGPFVRRFEAQFAEFCDARHALAVSNGTVALHLSLLAAGIGPGDEVIVPTLTFASTANAVVHCGGTPVFVDVDEQTWTIEPASVEAAVTPRTKALIPVHLYGHPADLDPLLEIASTHRIALIEDAAEAHGARYRGRRVGALGDAGIFSFYGNKIVTTGEGGMIVTNDDALAERVRLLRDHGMTKAGSYEHVLVGYNGRLTNLQAALGVAQMERIDDILEARRRLSDAYTTALADIPGVIVPFAAEWAQAVCWLYTLRIDQARFGISRDELIASLAAAAGVEARPIFPPVHRQPAYGVDLDLPVAEAIAATGLSLPSASRLTADDVRSVADALRGKSVAPAR